MHPRSSFRRALASVMLAVYTAFIVLGGAFVRCQEADGSTSIEWRGAGCCVPQAPLDSENVSALANSAESDDDCGGCEDQSLSETLTAARLRQDTASAVKAPDLAASTLAASAPVCPVVVALCEPGAWQARAPHPPPRLAAIRSTVLRC